MLCVWWGNGSSFMGEGGHEAEGADTCCSDTEAELCCAILWCHRDVCCSNCKCNLVFLVCNGSRSWLKLLSKGIYEV